MVVVVSHLFLFLGDKFRGRCDSHESHLPLCGTIYFPTAPFSFGEGFAILEKRQAYLAKIDRYVRGERSFA